MSTKRNSQWREIDVLRWIGARCPEGGGLSEWISASVLWNSGLVRTKDSGEPSSAADPRVGIEYLDRVDGPNAPILS